MWNGNTQLLILILHIDPVTQRKENLGSQKSNMSVVAKGPNVPDIITLIGRHVWCTKVLIPASIIARATGDLSRFLRKGILSEMTETIKSPGKSYRLQ